MTMNWSIRPREQLEWHQDKTLTQRTSVKKPEDGSLQTLLIQSEEAGKDLPGRMGYQEEARTKKIQNGIYCLLQITELGSKKISKRFFLFSIISLNIFQNMCHYESLCVDRWAKYANFPILK